MAYQDIRPLLSTLSCIGLFAFGAGPAPASVSESVIEEIIVTSAFRPVALEDTPVSISVISLNNMKAGAVNHLEEVLGWAPNVNVSSGASRARFIQIRGIGERGQFAETLNSSVGLILDGVDMSGIGTAATLFDARQVEILRGPQGTLYGANALAGLINVVSNDPSDSFTTTLALDAGNYDALGGGVVVSGPISDELGYRIAVRGYRDDGFIDNDFLGRENTDNHDELTVRGKLLWQPGDRTEIALTLGWIDIDNGFDAFSLDNDRNTLSDNPGQDRQETLFTSAKIVVDVGDAATFHGSVGYADSDIDYGYDEDWTFTGFDPIGYTSEDRYLRERTTLTADARFVSADTARLFGKLDWVIGVYGLHQEVDLRRQYTFLEGDFTSDFEVDRLAIYGEVAADLTARLRLSVGLRAERHESDYRDSTLFSASPHDDMLGGRIVLEAHVLADGMLYASASRGYKAGGFNTSGTLDDELRDFAPEKLWNYELGLKGHWLDGRLSARMALFTMRRDDVQVSTFIAIPRPDGSTEFIDLIDNAAEGTNSGLELELTFNPTDSVSLFANVGWLDTEFQDFINAAGEDLDGHDQAHAPSYQFHLGAEYRFGGRWHVRVEAEGRDGFYFTDGRRISDNPKDLKSDSYELLHASVGYEAEHWRARLWARNLTDKDYFVRGFYFGNDPRDFYTERGFTQLGEPRRFGVSFSWTL
jgi:outer membrane receptor protein involved in Fe transport